MINTSVHLSVGSATDKGVRHGNEDRLGIPEHTIAHWAQNPDLAAQRGWLFAVADGVGGQAAGEIASEMAVTQTLGGYYTSAETDAATALQRAIENANLAIYSEAQRNPRASNMGSTLVAALIIGDQLLVANVGDSRAYLIRGGQMRQISHDHSLVAEQLAAGLITAEEAQTHSMRHVITRSLGNQPEVTVDIFPERVKAGDVIVLCSDGLHGVVPDAMIAQVATSSPSAQAARKLVKQARALKSLDNISAIVIGIEPATGAAAVVPAAAPVRAASSPLVVGAVALLLVVVLLAVISVTQQRANKPVAPIPTEEPVASGSDTSLPTSTIAPTPMATSTVAPTAVPSPVPPTATASATRLATGTATLTPAPTGTATAARSPSRVVSPPTEIILDTKSPGIFQTTPLSQGNGFDDGNWFRKPGLGYKGNDVWYTYGVNNTSFTSTSSATWTTTVFASGSYTISVRIPGNLGLATRNAMYTIMVDGTAHPQKRVDQENNSDKWCPLGTYPVAANAIVIVQLGDYTGDTYSNKNKDNSPKVLFDVVKLEWAGEQASQ